MTGTASDFKQALRKFYRRPTSTMIAVLSLALGFAANNVVYSVIESCVNPRLGYKELEKLKSIREITPEHKDGDISLADYLTWRGNTQSFEDMTLSSYPSAYNLTDNDILPERITALQVDGNFFDFLGVRMVRGTGFPPATAQSARELSRLVVITHELWQRRYNLSPDIIGKTINLNGDPYYVQGVLPPEFRWMSFPAVSVFMPVFFSEGMITLESSQNHRYIVAGRLKSGVPSDRAQAELASMLHSRDMQTKGLDQGWVAKVSPLMSGTTGFLLPLLILLQIAIVLILLVCCSNVANLLVADAVARSREFAVRKALGAGTFHLLRQFIVEGLVLAGIAGVASMTLTAWAAHGVQTLVSRIIPYAGINPAVIVVNMMLLFLSAGIFAVAPGLFIFHGATADSLRDSGTVTTSNVRTNLFRKGLVVVQLSFTVVLLLGAVLLVDSFSKRSHIDVHFNSKDLLFARVPLLGPQYKEADARERFLDDLMPRLQALPGVKSAAAVSWIPLRGSESLYFELSNSQGQSKRPKLRYRAVTENYFRTLGVPILAGRDFAVEDRRSGHHEVIVSKATADKFWPGKSCVGEHIRIDNGDDSWREIVGVVDDLPDQTIYDILTPGPQAFELSGAPSASPWLLVRTAASPLSLAPSMRQLVAAIDPNQPLAGGDTLNTMTAEIDNQLQIPRLLRNSFIVLSVLALFISGLGVHGLASVMAQQRRHEMAIRMALGAHSRDILRVMLAPSIKLTVVSVALGLVAFLVFLKLVGVFIFGVSSLDAILLAATSLGLGLISISASYFPARRASIVDPMVELRSI